MNSFKIPKTCPKHPGENEDYILFSFSHQLNKGNIDFDNPSDTKAIVQYPCSCIYECAGGGFPMLVDGESKMNEDPYLMTSLKKEIEKKI